MDCHTPWPSVIELPVKGSWAPNVYISVLAVRGRVSDVQPTATVDLGRPAFRLGIAEIQVGWKTHELKVNVAAEHPVYKVRAQRFAGFYLNEDPEVHNFDPVHKVVPCTYIGSMGPGHEYFTEQPWGYADWKQWYGLPFQGVPAPMVRLV